jgi:small subunit ribosomal protein S21
MWRLPAVAFFRLLQSIAAYAKSKREALIMAEVRLQEGETLENALRRFKRKVLQEDIIKEVKRHAFYLKPGQKRRVKQALARKRNRKKLRRDSE